MSTQFSNWQKLHLQSKSLYNLFILSLNEEIEHIEQITVGQAENEIWHIQRKARITASNYYQVSTKVETLLKSERENVNTDSLRDSLLEKKGLNENIPSLKYGRNMEPIAKKKYLKYFTKEHKNTSSRESGLFVCKDKPFLGASPDLLVECSCCGQGIVEIKCPYSIVNKTPTSDNLPYLKTVEGKISLNRKHKYFAQIQGQMALSKRKWCHFFIFTLKDQYLEKIVFEQSYWEKLQSNLTYFYVHYMAPKLVESLS